MCVPITHIINQSKTMRTPYLKWSSSITTVIMELKWWIVSFSRRWDLLSCFTVHVAWRSSGFLPHTGFHPHTNKMQVQLWNIQYFSLIRWLITPYFLKFVLLLYSQCKGTIAHVITGIQPSVTGCPRHVSTKPDNVQRRIWKWISSPSTAIGRL